MLNLSFYARKADSFGFINPQINNLLALCSRINIYALHNPSDDEVAYQQEIARIKDKKRVWFILSLSKPKKEEFPRQKEILLNYLVVQ